MNFYLQIAIIFSLICIALYLIGLMFFARFFMESAARNPHIVDEKTYAYVSFLAFVLWLLWPVSVAIKLLFFSKKK